jgi:hypothetical protein
MSWIILRTAIDRMRSVFIFTISVFFLSGCGSERSDPSQALPSCVTGLLNDKDYKEGEIDLSVNDIVKAKLEDQDLITRLSRGRADFIAEASVSDDYRLPVVKDFQWRLVRARALTSGGPAGEIDFYRNVIVQGKYLPATSKLVIFTATPSAIGDIDTGYWVFVNVPTDANSIVLQCGQY